VKILIALATTVALAVLSIASTAHAVPDECFVAKPPHKTMVLRTNPNTKSEAYREIEAGEIMWASSNETLMINGWRYVFAVEGRDIGGAGWRGWVREKEVRKVDCPLPK